MSEIDDATLVRDRGATQSGNEPGTEPTFVRPATGPSHAAQVAEEPTPPPAAIRARKTRLGIEVGAKVVRLAQVAEVNGLPVMVAGSAIPRPADDSALALAIRSAISAGQLHTSDGAFLWTDAEVTGPVYQVFMELPPMSRAERQQVSTRELEKAAGGKLLTFAVEHAQLSSAQKGKLAKHMAIAMSDTAVDRACSVLRHAKLHVRGVFTDADALRGLRRMAATLPMDKVIAIVQCDGSHGRVGIFEGETLLFWRGFGASLPGGAEGGSTEDDRGHEHRGNADAASGYGPNLDPSAMDFDGGQEAAADPAPLEEEEAPSTDRGNPVALRFVDEIERSLAYFAQQHRPLRTEAVFVCGPGALTGEICGLLSSTYPCEPLASQGMGSDPGDYALAAGAAAASRIPQTANFSPRYLREQPEVYKVLGLGAVMLLAALGIGFSLEAGWSSRIDSAQRTLTDLQHQYDSLSQVRQAREALERVHQAQATWQNVLGQMDRYYDRWIELSLVLSASAPPQAVFENLDIQRAGPIYRGTVEATVNGPDLRAVRDAVNQLSIGLSRARTLQNVKVMPAESTREKDGSYKVKVQVSFDLAVAPPVGT